MCACVLGGCNFFSSAKLDTPTISVDQTTNTLSFNANHNASSYEIYINEQKVDEIVEKKDKSTYTFNYTDYLKKAGEYRFQVKAIGNSQYSSSKKTNTVAITYGTALDILNNNLSDIKYEESKVYSPKDVVINNKTITWKSPFKGIAAFELSLFSNTLGVVNLTVNKPETLTEDNELNYTYSYTIEDNYIVSHDVIAARVSSVYNEKYYVSNILYYNPVNNSSRSAYTTKYYIFKGGVYDYFIENLDELKNFYYYVFIMRSESEKFLVESKFYSNYNDTYFETVTNNADNYIMSYAYFETYAFSSLPTLSKLNKYGDNGDYLFQLTCRYSSKNGTKVTEPSYTGEGASSSTISQVAITPYYKTLSGKSGYTARDDKFVSDSWLLKTSISSSEQLYWAVTNHVTPVCVKGSRADLIYAAAKTALQEIIYNGMTDYEKSLAIFDYIMDNSIYDYDTYNKSATSNNDINPMYMSCYYLEGFFLNNNKLVVCDAMSKAFALLCNMEGINAVRVMGTASGGGHAWNKVYVNGAWYVVDITWTETVSGGIYPMYSAYSSDVKANYYVEGHINENEVALHTYFMVSDNEITTHKPFENDVLFKMMPANNRYNYYGETIYSNGVTNLTRVINSDADVKALFDYALTADVSEIEVVFTQEYISNNMSEAKKNASRTGKAVLLTQTEIFNALKKNKYLYSACSIEFVSANEVDENDIRMFATQVNLEYKEEGYFKLANGEIIKYRLPQRLAGYEYAEDKVGVLAVLKINASISSTKRLQKYLAFVETNNIQKSSNVTISKDFIENVLLANGKTTAEIAAMDDTQKETLFASYINSQLSGKTMTLKRIGAYTTSASNVQKDDGTYEFVEEFTTASFNIEFKDSDSE